MADIWLSCSCSQSLLKYLYWLSNHLHSAYLRRILKYFFFFFNLKTFFLYPMMKCINYKIIVQYEINTQFWYLFIYQVETFVFLGKAVYYPNQHHWEWILYNSTTLKCWRPFHSNIILKAISEVSSAIKLEITDTSDPKLALHEEQELFTVPGHPSVHSFSVGFVLLNL